MKYLKVIFFIQVALFYGCEKEEISKEIPAVRTIGVSQVTQSSVTISGNVSYSGTSAVIDHGFCWSTENTPTLADDHTTDGAWIGQFDNTISTLKGATVYYIRAYATNSVGTGYGEILSFQTKGALPEAITIGLKNNFPPKVTLIGFIKPNLLLTEVYFEYGIDNNYGMKSQIFQMTENGAVTAIVNDLIPNTTYHFRVVAKNEAGSYYGESMTFISQYSIGDNYYGGLVLYVDNTGLHGLICRETYTKIQNNFEWGPLELTGASETDLYTGDSNTDKILNFINPNDLWGYLVGVISQYNIDGNNNWYMASKDELNLVYTNIYLEQIGAFHDGSYWTSSEVNKDSVWVQTFKNGSQFIENKSGHEFATIAISKF